MTMQILFIPQSSGELGQQYIFFLDPFLKGFLFSCILCLYIKFLYSSNVSIPLPFLTELLFSLMSITVWINYNLWLPNSCHPLSSCQVFLDYIHYFLIPYRLLSWVSLSLCWSASTSSFLKMIQRHRSENVLFCSTLDWLLNPNILKKSLFEFCGQYNLHCHEDRSH